MKQAIQILFGLFLAFRGVTASGAERDILEIIKDRPPVVVVVGASAKYGDPKLDAAVDALGDIPHPWTVPRIIDVFRAEIEMWKGSEREEKRCGHLATLLAASCDPRAAVVLGEALDDRSLFPGALRAIEGLHEYFVHDPRYHQIPPATPGAYTNFYPEMTRRVKQWWALNKEGLKASTQAQ